MKELTKECLKPNLILDINEFNKNASYDDIYSLVSMVQTLIIMEKGTYPNHPDMGIGIRNYKFEFMDSITLNELRDNIVTQINKYLPNTLISNINVKTIRNELENKNNTVIVLIEFSQDDRTDIPKDVIISFVQVLNSKTVKSSIYI